MSSANRDNFKSSLMVGYLLLLISFFSPNALARTLSTNISGDTTDSVPDHHNKANVSIKQVT